MTEIAGPRLYRKSDAFMLADPSLFSYFLSSESQQDQQLGKCFTEQIPEGQQKSADDKGNAQPSNRRTTNLS